MSEKPILFTEHAVRRYVSLDLSPELIREIIKLGKRERMGKVKWRAARRSKRGIVVVIFGEYTDHIKVITVTKGK